MHFYGFFLVSAVGVIEIYNLIHYRHKEITAGAALSVHAMLIKIVAGLVGGL